MNQHRNPLTAAVVLVVLGLILAGGLKVAGVQVVGAFDALVIAMGTGLLMWAIGITQGENR